MRRVLAPALAVVFVLPMGAHAGAPPQRESVKAEEILPPAPEGWDLFESPEGHFSILLPTRRVETETEDAGVRMHVVQARTADDCLYAVLWSDDNGPDAASTLSGLLASIAEGRGVSSDHGSLIAGADRRAGLPGHRLKGSSARAEMDLRAYADGPRVYQLYAICPKEMIHDTAGGEHTAFAFAERERRAFFASFDVER
ncbi:MAG TPA: hypothetical protein VFV75_04890 [Candidatus Polarisedimenticolaceae bacterium]|nr:hypothetical protein [Candidatus Polarisedimenticolaceae bacterium]